MISFFFLGCLECSIFGVSLFFSYCEWVPVHSNQMSSSARAVSLSLMGLCILHFHSAPVCFCISFQMDFYRFSQIIIISLAIIFFLKTGMLFFSFNLLYSSLSCKSTPCIKWLKSHDHQFKFSGEIT